MCITSFDSSHVAREYFSLSWRGTLVFFHSYCWIILAWERGSNLELVNQVNPTTFFQKMRRKQIQRWEEKAPWKQRAREWRTNPNLFRATSKFVCNSLDPIFDNQHTLGTAKTSERSITWLVGETNLASNSHVFKTVTIVRVEHCSLQNWSREVQRISTVVVDVNI